MLKESLPFYRKNPPSGQDDALNKLLSEIDPKANLYNKKELFHREKELKLGLIALCKVLVFLLSCALIGLVVVEKSFNNKITSLTDSANAKLEKIKEYQSEYKTLRQVEEKLAVYGRIDAQRSPLGDPIEQVFKETSPYVILNSFNTSKEDFRISAKSKSAVDVVQALYKVLQSDVVSTLSLTSAEIEDDGSFAIELRGFYKQ